MSTHSSPFATLRLCVIILLILGISGALETPSVIIIDPGHGGSKVAGSLKTRSNSSPNNVTTAGGLMEKDLTLEFSKTLKERVLREACSQGKRVGVLLTREDDRNLDFVQRATIANRPDTACVVSIHFNSGGGKSATGVSLSSLRKNATPVSNLIAVSVKRSLRPAIAVFASICLTQKVGALSPMDICTEDLGRTSSFRCCDTSVSVRFQSVFPKLSLSITPRWRGPCSKTIGRESSG